MKSVVMKLVRGYYIQNFERFVWFVLLSVGFNLLSPAYAKDANFVTGIVIKVRDGDTIEVGKVPIRLKGVSAPELGEPLGLKSKEFMLDLVMGKQLRCELSGKKTYDRFVGTCYLGKQDIGAAVVAKGLALDCPRYSGGRYAEYEVKSVIAKIKLPKYCK